MISPALLRTTPVFCHLSDQQLNSLAEVAEERTYPAGTVVHREDETADTVYLILSGRVGVRFSLRPFMKSRQLCLDILQPGELFGWSALVPPHKLTGSAVCMEEVHAVAWPRDGIQAAMDHDPALGYRVMACLSEVVATRLRDSRMQLVQELASTAQD